MFSSKHKKRSLSKFFNWYSKHSDRADEEDVDSLIMKRAMSETEDPEEFCDFSLDEGHLDYIRCMTISCDPANEGAIVSEQYLQLTLKSPKTTSLVKCVLGFLSTEQIQKQLVAICIQGLNDVDLHLILKNVAEKCLSLKLLRFDDCVFGNNSMNVLLKYITENANLYNLFIHSSSLSQVKRVYYDLDKIAANSKLKGLIIFGNTDVRSNGELALLRIASRLAELRMFCVNVTKRGIFTIDSSLEAAKCMRHLKSFCIDTSTIANPSQKELRKIRNFIANTRSLNRVACIDQSSHECNLELIKSVLTNRGIEAADFTFEMTSQDLDLIARTDTQLEFISIREIKEVESCSITTLINNLKANRNLLYIQGKENDLDNDLGQQLNRALEGNRLAFMKRFGKF